MPSTKSPMEAAEPLEPGDPAQVGGYRLIGRLGAGGMGQVFLGVSRGGRKVAVKILRPELGADAEFRTRFAREVAAARTVNGFYTAPVSLRTAAQLSVLPGSNATFSPSAEQLVTTEPAGLRLWTVPASR